MDKGTEPAGGLAIAADAAEAAADLLPLDMLAAVADLVDPAAVAREMPWLAGELTKIALGRPDISFDQRDHPDGYIELRDRAKDIVISGGRTFPRSRSGRP